MRPTVPLAARGLLLTALLVLPSAAAAQEGLAGPAEGESLSTWTERWLDGPVGLIATDEEKALYAELETAQARLQFIRLFWERRDPRLAGPRNEYLDELASRLAYAEEEFGNSREEGWETIFGRVVLLFGIPDRTRREMGFSRDFSDRPPILWSYDERLPGLEPNEDLMFVFRGGRWRLAPASGFGDSGVAAEMREMERQSMLAAIPAEYEEAMEQAVQVSLANSVDYSRAADDVSVSVRLPESQIPFSWSARSETSGEAARLELDLSWRVDSLVFHLVDDTFRTDMVVDVRLSHDGQLRASTSEVLEIVIPEGEMEDRRQEVVRRTVGLQAAPGEYDIEIVLVDQLLGYRTVYRDTVRVEG